VKRIVATAIVIAGLLAAAFGATKLITDSWSRPAGVEPLLGSSPLPPPEKLGGRIEVWSWNIAAEALKSVIPGYNRRCPGVDVFVNMTGANMQTRFFLSLSARTGGPDVMQLQNREGPLYSQSGRLTDLTLVAAKYEKEFAPAFWRNVVNNGRIFAIPWDMGPCAVFYRRDLFEKFGVDPLSIETWDDFIEVGKRMLKQSGGKTKMLHLPKSNYLESFFEIMLQQNCGQVFDDEGRLAINSEQSLQALRTIRKLIDSDIGSAAEPWSAEMFASLQNDSVATIPMAVWFGGTIKLQAPKMAGKWGVFRLPALEPGGSRVSNLGGSILVIPDQCANKEAAWAYVEYALCTVEGQLQQYKTQDLFPSLMTAYDDPFFEEPDPYFAGQKARRLFATEIERIPTLNRTHNWNEAEGYLGQALSAWAGENTSPEEFLNRIEGKMALRMGVEISPSSLSLKRSAGR